MSGVFGLVLALSLSGSVLILALTLGRRLFRNALPKSWQYYLWFIVLLRLVVPLTPSIGPIVGLFPELIHQPVSIQRVAQDEGPALTPADTADAQANISALPARSGEVPVAAEATGRAVPADAMEAMGIVWLIGAVAVFLIRMFRYARFANRLRMSARPVTDTGTLRVYREAAAAFGLKKRPVLLHSARISSPMLIGLMKPAILLPESAISGDIVGLPYVFRHELTHYRRRDILCKWFAEFCLCVHWFNPLAYLMTDKFAEACELSCDEAVASFLDADERLKYGKAVLDTAAMASVGGHLLSVGLRGDKAAMKERLGTILKSGKTTKASIFTSVTLTLVLGVLAVLLGACTAGNPLATTGAAGLQTQAALSPSPSSSPSPSLSASPSASVPAEATGNAKDEEDVRALVESFGKVLKNVSLLAQDNEIMESMEANYATYVTPELLADWEANPSVRAAGRLTSSPWPDRIDISSVIKNADGSYTVTGTIVEVTSAEAGGGSAAATRPVEMKAVLSGGKWLISEFTAGDAEPADKNTD